MNRVRVSLGGRSYDILIGSGLMNEAGTIIKKLLIGNDAIIVTNKNIAALHGKALKNSLLRSGMTAKIELVPDSERAKDSATLIRLLNRIGSYDKNKTLFIIALGGGVVGDLAGFAAAIYKRGVPYVQIPTTLLAQVDSAIGGKVAIDLQAAKNLVGSFYQPRVVISDISVLRSLPPRQLRNGLAECIKYGVIKDSKLFGYLENNYRKVINIDEEAIGHLVLSASKIKARIVGEDELDKKGARIVLNYGHTIGHAIEAASKYSKKYNHGEAVAIGMIVAASISSKLGLVSGSCSGRIESLVKKCGLPTRIKGLKFTAIYEAHLHDKKFVSGKNRFILPLDIGRVRVVEGIPDSLVIKSIKEFIN